MSKKKNAAARRLARVQRAFDAEALIRICEMDASEFGAYAPRVDLPAKVSGWAADPRERFYYYKDNGSDILAVAHLDTVQDNRTCKIEETAGGLLAVSGALDDRLGVYVITELLPALGITCDILLTTDEERGDSTAAEFDTDKRYNWMIEFDRGGTDVVMYQYETPELADLLDGVRADVGIGSYSDIAELEHLGCAGFNWGVGYEDYHSKRSHAWLEDTFKMVSKFTRFHTLNAATFLEYEDRYDVTAHCPRCDGTLSRYFVCMDCGIDWVHDDPNEIDVEDEIETEEDREAVKFGFRDRIEQPDWAIPSYDRRDQAPVDREERTA